MLLAQYRGNDLAYLDARSGDLVTWRDLGDQTLEWEDRFKTTTAVGLYSNSPAVFCRAYLAALAAGVCVVPIDTRATRDELVSVLDLLEISELVVDPSSEEETAETGLNIWVSSAAGLLESRRTRFTVAEARPADVILTASGSTGDPHFVPLFESQLLRVATRIARHNELCPHDRGYSPLPLCHVNAQVVAVLANLVSGSSLVVDDRFHRSDFWEVCGEFGATWLNLVPAILSSLGEGPLPTQVVSDRVRFARSDSAPLSHAVLKRFQNRCGIGVLETYGKTEAASQIAANPMRTRDRRAGSVGRPIGVQVRITGKDGHTASVGETGSIKIGGPDVMEWYIGRGRSHLAAHDSEGWLHTGDLGWRDAEGYLYLDGREGDLSDHGDGNTNRRSLGWSCPSG
jgi:acyl-CoA synthetase (AMP-forming)/AMP-acid ligase II